METSWMDKLYFLQNLSEQVRRAKEEADAFRQECADVGKKSEKVGQLLRVAARVGPGNLYARPATMMFVEVQKALEKTLVLLRKCKRSGVLRRVITMVSAGDFKKVTLLLDNSIGDITWLLNVSAVGDDRPGLSGMPPIACNDPVLSAVWELIAVVQVGTAEEKTEGAKMLATYAKENERNCKLVIDEGGVPPLLKLLKGDNVAGQEAAANALGVLARDGHRLDDCVDDGVVQVFVHVLNNGAMKVQAKVAWALAQMVTHCPEAQDSFANAGAIRSLVAILAYDTVEEAPKVQEKSLSIHSLVKASMAQNKVDGTTSATKTNEQGESMGEKSSFDKKSVLLKSNSDPEAQRSDNQRSCSPLRPTGVNDPLRPTSEGVGAESGRPAFLKPALSFIPRTSDYHRTTSFDHSANPENGKGGMRVVSRQERDRECPEMKARLKAEAAHAIWKLAENNVKNSKSITDTRALLCFAKLIESGEGDVQLNSVMAVMEIALAAEQDAELRRSAFKAHSPAAKAVVEQLLHVIDDGEPELQLPCIRAIGCLARIFPAHSTTVLRPLTGQLATTKDGQIATEAAIALQKFANQDNYLHLEHSKTILEFSGACHLVQLIYFGDPPTQLQALILLSYLALNVGDSDALEKAESLRALESATRWPTIAEDVKLLLFDAVQHLELYHAGSKNSRKVFMTM